jgi:hypothetical protein
MVIQWNVIYFSLLTIVVYSVPGCIPSGYSTTEFGSPCVDFLLVYQETRILKDSEFNLE